MSREYINTGIAVPGRTDQKCSFFFFISYVDRGLGLDQIFLLKAGNALWSSSDFVYPWVMHWCRSFTIKPARFIFCSKLRNIILNIKCYILNENRKEKY